MLRNQIKCKQITKHLQSIQTQQQHRYFHRQANVLYNKSTNVFRQGKIMSKLFGNRISGSKKRWFPSIDSTHTSSPTIVFNHSQIGKASNSGGKNATRRMTVLNKLFMKHITDLMATGEISESILGKGLQVSRVKISQDFAYVNVFWLTSGDPVKDTVMEQELQRCSGLLRHELSQLGLMGVVPRIKFVKDKLYTNLNQVEALLRNMDFGTEDDEEEMESINKHAAETLKQEFYGQETLKESLETKVVDKEEPQEENVLQVANLNVPEMRHDVLGLDHKGIMLKILTKMRKSKQAWDQHQQGTLKHTECIAIPSTSFEHLAKTNEKLAQAAANAEKFESFLAKRREKRNTPERKKFRKADHHIDVNTDEQYDYPELVMSARQRQIYEAEDYLAEDIDDKRI